MSNILIMIPSLGQGGSERVVSKLSLQLDNRHNIYICLNDENQLIKFKYRGKLVYLNIPGVDKPLKKILNLYLKIKRLKQLKRTLNVEVSVSFINAYNILNVLTKKNNKVVISERSSRFVYENNNKYDKIYEYAYKILRKWLYKKADLVVVPSKSMAIQITRDYNIPVNNVHTIYNGYNIEQTIKDSKKPLEKEFEEIFSYPVILQVGRLVMPKGQWHLIRIFTALKNLRPNVKLVLIGDGKMRNEIVKFAQSTGLKVFIPWNNWKIHTEYDIYFLGSQDNPFRFLSRAKVFAFTSIFEGFPNTLLEAMICGVPVIAADCISGPREILSNDKMNSTISEPEYTKFGVLMPRFSGQIDLTTNPLGKLEKMWVKVIGDLLENEALRLEYINMAKIRASDFRMVNIIKQWEKVLSIN